jgi:predicted dienelactone hydrolase
MKEGTAMSLSWIRTGGCALALLASTLWGEAAAAATAYDPLATPPQFVAQTLDLEVHDAARNRDIPLRVYLPQEKSPAPVVLFSHGLGGSREGNRFMGEHWSARGYVAVFLQHPGSDNSVWKGQPPREAMPALRGAANLQNFLLRVKDVPAVLDQLDRWNRAAGNPLQNRLDLARVGMSGHSFGAITTQAVSGQSTASGQRAYTDPRIKAAMAFSPSASKNTDPAQTFGQVKIPWMLMTGTKDDSPIGEADAASRLAVFPALPPGHKYELVLFSAEHSAFTDRALPGDREPRNPNHHRAILALSTAFWDAYLRNDTNARVWLDGSGAGGVLEKEDCWTKK